MFKSRTGSLKSLTRRQLLRGAGVALALPLLDAMIPAFGRRALAAPIKPTVPKRMFAICNNLGVLKGNFFPQQSGREYQLSPYLTDLAEFRGDFSVFSGVSHPGVDGSHSSDVSFLTAAPHPAQGGFRNSQSLDQYIASQIGNQTRFPSLTLGVNVEEGRKSLSWTANGVLIPCENSAAAIYQRLFLKGSNAEIEHQVRKLQLGQSIMDALAGQAKSLNRKLGPADRDRMEQFTTAVRDVEQRMMAAQEWEKKTKPTTAAQMPVDPNEASDYLEKCRLMYQMARLAFETDSTRSITLMLDSSNSPTIIVPGAEISDQYHNLSHHGQSSKKLNQLAAIDHAHMKLLAELLGDLKSATAASGSLLNETMVLYGSNFGDANKHTTDNLPVLLAGGGFRHGQHLAFDETNNYPLPNLFVSMLQQMNIETDTFASSTGTLRGLDF